MIFLKNMKIRTKLFLGFLLLLIIAVAIALFGAANLRSVDNRYTYALSYPFERYSIIKDLGTHFMDARRAMNRAAMYIHDPIDPIAGINSQEELIIDLRKQIDDLLTRYRANIAADPGLSDEYRDYLYGLVDAYEIEVHRYFDHYIAGLIEAARAYDELEAIRLVRVGILTVDRALAHYRQLDDDARTFMHHISGNLSAQTDRTLLFLVMLTVVFIFIGAAVSVFISGTVTDPIQNVESILRDIKNGKLNIEVDRSKVSVDELGHLIRDMIDLAGSVQSINAEIKGMIVAAADKGDMHYVIDADKYSGEWREIMNGLNRIAQSVDAPITEIRDVMNYLAKGNFDRKVTGDYKGDFLQIKEAVNYTVDDLSRYVETERERGREVGKLAMMYMDACPMLIAMWDEQSNLVDLNDQFVEFFGFSSKGECIRRYRELWTEYQPCGTLSLEKTNEIAAEILRDGCVRFEWTYQTPRGEVVPTEVTGVRIERNGTTYVLEYIHDLRPIQAIMQREHALEMQLHDQEMNKRIRLVLDFAPMAVAIYDENHVMIDCNEEAVKMFRLSDKSRFVQAMNERFSDFSAPVQPCGRSAADKGEWMFEEATANGCVQLEWTHLTADGEPLPTAITFARVDYQDSHMFIAYMHDLRTTKAKEEKEREDRDFINALYEASPMFIDIWDEDCVCIECNDKVCDLLGVAGKEDFLCDIDRYSPKNQPCGTDSDELWARYFKTCLEEGYVRFNWTHIDANGSEVPIEVTYVRMTRQGRQIMVGYSYDLRQIRELEKVRLEISEESNRAKTRFLAQMSHEIRTPITAVMGISEIQLRNTDLPPALEEAFAKIHDSSKTLLSIVSDILDFSKIESGKMTLILAEYDMASLISNAAQLHAVYTDKNDVAFHMEVDENLPAKLIGDELRLRQIMNNLLSNALKYTSAGRVDFSISCQPGKGDSVILVISIRDTGLGMTREQVDAISSEYIRFHERETFVSGTGLGVSIVYSLLQMMNAHIEWESEVGVGTHVVVRVPQTTIGDEVLGNELADSLERFETGTWLASKKTVFEPTPMPHGKVLVVDDVLTNLYVMEAMLEAYELNIELCEGGQEAIDKISEGNEYDIVFMDHMMPGMDGIEAAKILRGMGYERPIIAFTANTLKGQAELFMSSGFNGFISKPIDATRLDACIHKFIRQE
ncbi:MAG: response regulator [Oscillospiraceae bacterium]|nr:response regulator [Oscillospiraceae bacterium]